MVRFTLNQGFSVLLCSTSYGKWPKKRALLLVVCLQASHESYLTHRERSFKPIHGAPSPATKTVVDR